MIEREIRKKRFNTNLTPDFGKIPPQAIQLEEAVLGAIMIDTSAMSTISDLLKPEAFYKEVHQCIYKAVETLFRKGDPIDILTVVEQLKRDDSLELIGGPYYLTQLTNRISSAANIETHARIVVQKYAQRELIRTSSEVSMKSFEDIHDVFDLIDLAEKNVVSVSEILTSGKKGANKLGEIVRENVSKYVKLAAGEVVNGVPVMFKAIRRFIPQYSNGDLIIVAGRPGMGKTAQMISEAKMYAEAGIPVAIFSEEMSKTQLADRFLSQECGLPVTVIRSSGLSIRGKERLHEAENKLDSLPIYIEDDLRTVYDVRPRLLQLIHKYGVKIAYFDYIQRSRTGEKIPREQEINTISQTLKTTARKCNVPVVAYAQLNRSVETRGGDHRPMLSDLRESGSLEQEADCVMFIFRPEYYKVDELKDGTSTKNYAEIIIAKHRQGSLGTPILEFIDNLMLFKDTEEEVATDNRYEVEAPSVQEDNDLPF